MIEIIDSKEIKSVEEIRNTFNGKKVLVIIDKEAFEKDKLHIRGTVYAVSADVDSYDELVDKKWELEHNNKFTVIVGSYGGGMDIGLQYEIRK